MNRFTKKLLVLTMLFSVVVEAWADKGIGRKSKNKTILNISAPSNLKNSLSFNIKSGLSYKGSLLDTRQTIGSSIMNTSIVTYQKGNTTFIVPNQYRLNNQRKLTFSSNQMRSNLNVVDLKFKLCR